MSPDQWSQCAVITWCHEFLPSLQGHDLSNRQGVDVHHAILNQVQREHADFIMFAAITSHFSTSSEEHKIGGTTPLLDHVQPFMDLSTQLFEMKIAAEKYRLDGFAKLGKSFVGRMLNTLPDKSS